MEKRTESVEGKKPWEAGFCEEEFEQKKKHRAAKGDDPEAIKDAILQAERIKGYKDSN